jgi:hypothetical protein
MRQPHIPPTGRVNLSAPIDHHPDVIRGQHIEAVPELLQLARAPMAEGFEVSKKLTDLSGRVPDKAVLAREAAPMMERVTRQFDSAVQTLTQRRDALEREIAATLTPSALDPVATEIRAHFKGRPTSFEDVAGLVRGGDARVTAAVLSAPAFLSGLTPEQHGVVRQFARDKFTPAQHGLSEDLGRNLDRMRAAGTAFVNRVGGQLAKWTRDDAEDIRQELAANGS